MSVGIMDFKSTVAALTATVMISLPMVVSAESRADSLLQELQGAEDATAADRLERQIIDEWSKSGSPAMDLLLKRGQNALEVKKHAEAAEHFRALTDHAPDFAEGWHGLALAYFQANRFGPAMDALERTLAINPHHFAALRGVGAVHEQTGHPALAYEAYERVLELRPHDEDVLQALGRLEATVKGIKL
ncbi:tetratricopeptide repeat protein [Pacificoceanicola onchidii]|uniref:tetratricopeptide repeat protein n=1 Tax=Pacificoceanicola onchidii TaxID=2562685 RepID=UPI001F0F9958|nr:tetratricopeptide repeat protein [Pacificoceanicola onchidii]